MRPFVRRAWLSVRQSFVAIAAIAIVIATTTTTFSIVNGAVLKPTGIPDIDRIVHVEAVYGGRFFDGVGLTPDRWRRLQARQPRLLESWVGSGGDDGNLSTDDVSQPVVVEQVSGPYFNLFGVRPLVGRLLTSADTATGSACCAAVISEHLWRTTFRADARVVGTVVHVLSRSFVVAGVAPAAFHGVRTPQLISTDVWIPAAPAPAGPGAFGVFARLAPGATFEAARGEIRALGRGLDPNDPSLHADLWPAWQGMTPPPLVAIGVAVAIAALVVCVAIVLLGAATAINLSRARFLTRRREFAIRLALGAQKSHLTRQAIADAFAVAAPAALVGSAGALMLIRLAGSLQLIPAAGAYTPQINLTPDGHVWAFVIVAALVLVVFLARAEVEAMWTEPSALAGGALTTSSASSNGSSLMGLGAWQLGIATTLLIVAGLFLQSSASHVRQKTSLSVDHTVVGHVAFNQQQSATAARTVAAMLANPVGASTRMALMTSLPVATPTGITRAGAAYGAKGSLSAQTHLIGASSELLDVLGLPILAGSGLPVTFDAHSDAAVIDETLAHALWPSGQAVGHRLWLAGSDDPLRVVGVVRAPVHADGVEDFRRFVFVPMATQRLSQVDIVLSGPESDHALVDRLRQAVRAADPNILLTDLQPLGDYADPYAKVVRAALWPTVLVAGLAVMMALAGLFAVVNHNVVARVHEFGIRKALGAPSARIYAQILRESIGVVLRGTGIGIVAAVPVPLLLPKQMLFALRGGDMAVLAVIPASAFLVAILAMLPAAYRATRSDPLVAMRAQ